MKVLFMSLGVLYHLEDSSVHLDILKRFAKDHDVWLACKNEDRPTELTTELGIHVLRIHTGELKKVGTIKKGINTILVERQFRNAIRQYFTDVKFDLILYSTPPITFASAVKYIKKRDHASAYLMLKDIFPQNAVDLGMLKTTGLKGILYKYFRNKEKQLYKLSDYIGCMSPANVDFILRNNPQIDPERVEVCPNTSVIQDVSVDLQTRNEIREKYQIPLDKTVFVYGGNLGKPQGIPFLIQCLKEQNEQNAFFLIIGQGMEYDNLNRFMQNEAPENCRLMKSLPKEDYETLVAACDIGMIFLDHRFTIPNFPSRILSYMKAKIPILAVTDPNTDVGTTIVNGNFGWWCESNDSKAFVETVGSIIRSPQESIQQMGCNGYEYMKDHYSPDSAYETIIRRMSD